MDTIKKIVGYQAAELVQDNTIVGIGTGSTAFYFIEKLIVRVADGLRIRFVASSAASHQQALQGNLIPADLTTLSHIDLTVDGADEIDPQLHMIKGGGGALLREKILAYFSRSMIVIVDETKLSPHLGKVKIPVEILPFAASLIIQHIENTVGKGQMRKKASGEVFVTDNGNFIFDIHPLGKIASAQDLHAKLIAIPGVIETGLFFNVAKLALIGYQDKNIQVIQAKS